MILTKRDSGRIGGILTAMRHGTILMREIGILGGRPRATNWMELQVLLIRERKER